MGTKQAKTGTINVNGLDTYHEIRGSGPSVLFITQDAMDAAQYEKLADELADEFTVVTYDRRGYSRSRAPEGWTATSPQEQSEDAAALIEALGIGPAAVFGSSGGAVVLLDLIVRRPEVLRGALVHEPPIIGVLPNAEEVGGQLQAMVEQGFAKGGPAAAIEHFARNMQGDSVIDRIDPGLKKRLLENAEAFFGIHMPGFMSYLPDAEALAAAHCPVIPLAGAENRGTFLYATTEWVARQVRADIVEVPGRHGGFMDQPVEFAEVIRPILRKLS